MKTELTIPVVCDLTARQLLEAIEADWQRARRAHEWAKENVILPECVLSVYRKEAERLHTARDVIRFYLEAAEEACTMDVDEPIPYEVTPAGTASLAA